MTIDCSDVTLNIQLGHDDHAHEPRLPAAGCSGTFVTANDGGHGATRTSSPRSSRPTPTRATAPPAPITGRDEAILHTKRKRAQYFDSTGRAPGGAAGGTPGVQTEATSDTGGGNNIGFIERRRLHLVRARATSRRPPGSASAWPRPARAARSSCGWTRRPASSSARRAFIKPTGGWQTWANVDLALPRPAGGHARAVHRVQQPGGQRQLADEHQLVPGRSAGRGGLRLAGRLGDGRARDGRGAARGRSSPATRRIPTRPPASS